MRKSFPHDLDPKSVRQATEHALMSYAERFSEYAPQVQWLDDGQARISFAVMGRTLEALLEIGMRVVTVDMNVPLLLRPFQSKAIDVVGREIQVWIERAQRGELE